MGRGEGVACGSRGEALPVDRSSYGKSSSHNTSRTSRQNCARSHTDRRAQTDDRRHRIRAAACRSGSHSRVLRAVSMACRWRVRWRCAWQCRWRCAWRWRWRCAWQRRCADGGVHGGANVSMAVCMAVAMAVCMAVAMAVCMAVAHLVAIIAVEGQRLGGRWAATRRLFDRETAPWPQRSGQREQPRRRRRQRRDPRTAVVCQQVLACVLGSDECDAGRRVDKHRACRLRP
jgi:hypothetical protein